MQSKRKKTKPQKLSKSQLKKLRKKLPRGAVKRISEEVGISRQAINDVFNGNYINTEVIKKAIEIAEEQHNEQSQLSQKINSIL